MRIIHDERELLVEIAIEPGRANRARLNGSPKRRPRDVLGALRMVLFAPEDLALVRGEPAERRRYLDDILVARQPRFASGSSRLRPGAQAAKRVAAHAPTWRGRPAPAPATSPRSGCGTPTSPSVRRRAARRTARAVCGLAPYVAKAYDGGERRKSVASIAYQCGLSSSPPDRGTLTDMILAALLEARKTEIDRGVTTVGPHRDDVALTLGEFPAKGYASHGESWSFALALRLAAYELLRAEGIEPVLALDDVFAELDAGRRERLAELVGGASQLLVTCAVAADIPDTLRGVRLHVVEGGVERG